MKVRFRVWQLSNNRNRGDMIVTIVDPESLTGEDEDCAAITMIMAEHRHAWRNSAAALFFLRRARAHYVIKMAMIRRRCQRKSAG